MGMTCACHNLRRASRAVTQIYDSFFDELGIRATQFTVLSAIAWAGSESPKVTDLAETLVLEQSSLSRNLAVLERQGLVKLARGDDRRERLVALTRGGRALLAKGYPIWQRAQAAISKALDPRDLDSQLRALRRITKTALDLRPATELPARTAEPRRRARRAPSPAPASRRRNLGKTATRSV